MGSSPVRDPGVREKPLRRKREPGHRAEPAPKRKRNSEMFPKSERPVIFQDDDKFDTIGVDKAANICYKHSVEEDRKKKKEQKKNTLEKCDDVLKKVMVPAGGDDAKDELNIEARKLRPVCKEIKKIMDWIPLAHKEIIRNLPLAVYGLRDGVASKSIELAHNLASHIQIKMFPPANLRSSANNQRHKDFSDKEGQLIVEQEDMFEDIGNTVDVMMAWTNLDCVWQKHHSNWPAAKIAMRVILMMRMFVHCGQKAKDIMVLFSNRFLTICASNAANREEPMDFERALNLDRDVCYNGGFLREPPAKSSDTQGGSRQQFGGSSQQSIGSSQQSGSSSRGGSAGEECKCFCAAGELLGEHCTVMYCTVCCTELYRAGVGLCIDCCPVVGQSSVFQSKQGLYYRVTEGGTRGGQARPSQAAGSQGGTSGSGSSVLRLQDGSVLCGFYQTIRCNMQSQAHCVRGPGIRKHLCAFRKADGSFCAAKHPTINHK